MRKSLFSANHFCRKVRSVTEDALFIHFNCYIPQICEFIMSMRKCFHFFQNDTFLAKICENRYFQQTFFCRKVHPVTEDALLIHFNCYIPQICEFILSTRKCFHFFQTDTFLAKICENRYFQRTIFAQKCVRSLKMHFLSILIVQQNPD